jgi:hypothetical protein
VPGMQLDQIAHQIVADDPERGDWPVTYYQTHRDRFIGDVTLVPSLVAEHGRILEIGSSPPFVTAALSQRGYDVAGVDIAPDRFAGSIARFGLEVHACDIEQERLPFDSDNLRSRSHERSLRAPTYQPHLHLLGGAASSPARWALDALHTQSLVSSGHLSLPSAAAGRTQPAQTRTRSSPNSPRSDTWGTFASTPPERFAASSRALASMSSVSSTGAARASFPSGSLP